MSAVLAGDAGDQRAFHAVRLLVVGWTGWVELVQELFTSLCFVAFADRLCRTRETGERPQEPAVLRV